MMKANSPTFQLQLQDVKRCLDLDAMSTSAGASEKDDMTATTVAITSVWEDVFACAIEEIGGSWGTKILK